MLSAISPSTPNSCAPPLPALLVRVRDAVRAGSSFQTEVEAIVASLGFDSFMYGMSTAPYPLRGSRTYVWTTLPAEWVQIYDRNAYVEIDPRLTQCWERVTPLIWDQQISGADRRATAFLDHAAQYGVGSGVVVPLRDPLHPLVLVALNSAQRVVGSTRLSAIYSMLGDIVLLASHFHEAFMAGFVDAGLAPRQQGAPLSPRELQCLQFACNGLTSADIAFKLGLAERTVNFHFCNIITKLAAANRGEAIALAVSRRIISPH
jgi:DNA-binding CsgD family transcriptional regulator